MPDEPLEALKRTVRELSDAVENLSFSFWKKTGPASSGITGTDLESTNFSTGVSGWRLDADGNLEANDGNFRGDITGASGTFSGTLTGGSLNIPDTTTDSSFHVEADGDTWWGNNVADGHATAPAKILKDGAATFSSVAVTGGSITGTPIASIPNNSSTDISLLDFTHDLVFSETDADTVAWASGTITMSNGRTFSITGSNTGNMAAKTYVYLDTAISSTALQTTTTVATAMGANKKLIAVAQNGTGAATWQVNQGIGGLKITAAMTSIANNDWTFSGTWSVTDADTVAWGSGTLTTSNGGSYSITGSNTGNMAAKTYIYFALGTSSTAFQTTTTAATAIGEGKILIAVAQNGTGEANYIVMNDKQHNIDAANIVAGSITANEIAASTITAAKMSVSQLSAIAADLGTITAGTVTGATIRTSSSNPKFTMDSTTFQGIETSGATVFEVVVNGANAGDVIMGDDASGSYAMWDDSAGTFNVFADNVPVTTTGTFGGDGSDGALTLTSGTTTISAASAALLVKNYTSISITSTGELDFSNPHAGGTLVILKSQGNVALTSTAPSIDLRGMGATVATEPNGLMLGTNTPAGQTTGDPDIETPGGARYDAYNFYTLTEAGLSRRYVAAIPGPGGGTGAGGSEGAGGRGGGALVIECQGALNFTGSVNSSGTAGSNASGAGGGGGGGGAAGMVVMLYNTLTSAAGTITATGGAGGNATSPDGDTGGGGGAGSPYGAGGNGGASGGSGPDAAGGNGAGGGGGAGTATGTSGGASMGGLVAKNYYFG